MSQSFKLLSEYSAAVEFQNESSGQRAKEANILTAAQNFNTIRIFVRRNDLVNVRMHCNARGLGV